MALALKLKQKDGVWTIRGKEIVVLQPGAAYLPILFDGGGDSHSPFGAAGAGGCCGLLRDVDYGCVAVYPGGLFHLKIDVKTKTGPIE